MTEADQRFKNLCLHWALEQILWDYNCIHIPPSKSKCTAT